MFRNAYRMIKIFRIIVYEEFDHIIYFNKEKCMCTIASANIRKEC